MEQKFNNSKYVETSPLWKMRHDLRLKIDSETCTFSCIFSNPITAYLTA